MEDKEIIKLLYDREERGLKALQEIYYERLVRFIMNFVSEEDAKECINDALLSVWNSIPPNQPEHLYAYTAKICRNRALNMIRSSQCQKRRAEIIELSDELLNIIPNNTNENPILTELINEFLSKEKRDDRYLFVHRYWYGESVAELAMVTGYSNSKVKSKLFRSRKRLKKLLEGRYSV